MAIEAISQIKNLRDSPGSILSFTFRNVNIQSAFIIRQDDTETELFTSMHAEQITTASTSDIWFEFSISSYQNGNPTQHCIGSIRFDPASRNSQDGIRVDAKDYNECKMGRWYEKLSAEGLCYGPAFQSLESMKNDKTRLKTEVFHTTTLVQQIRMKSSSAYPGTFYVVHPVVIDSCLQASIIANTAGDIGTLKAYMPVFISHCRITNPASEQVGKEALIHSKCESTGFGTIKIDVTLRDKSDKAIIDISDSRLALYKTKTEDIDLATYERHPCLRVIWKPDVARLSEVCQPQLEAYLQRFVANRPDLNDNQSVGITAALIDLIGHKNPRLRVLELENECDCKSRQWLEVLNKNSKFPRYQGYQVGSFAENDQLFVSPASNPEKTKPYSFDTDGFDTYDLLILPKVCMNKSVG